MLWRSFPQWILNIFIIQDLRIYEPLNVTTTCLSACSVVCGLAEYLALSVNDDDEILDYPFSTTIWGMLTILTDTMLRGIFLAYAMTIIKILVILIPIVYGILMLITILITRCKDTHKTLLSGADVLDILLSFVCSAYESVGLYEYKDVKYTFRLMSKCIFSSIIVVTALSIGQIFLQNWLTHLTQISESSWE